MMLFVGKMYYFCGKKRKNMNKEITEKIKKLRAAKGINQSEMAHRLNVTRSTYQKIEAGEGYAWAKYLNELMTILETTPKDFFSDIGSKNIHQNTYNESVGVGYYVVEHLHQENKEVYEKLIASKDEQIEFLKGLLGKK